jgi:MFS family permease
MGVVIVPFGLILRNRLPETLHAADDAALAPDATTGSLVGHIGRHGRAIVCGLVLLTCGTIGSYVLTYLPTYALETLHMTADVSFGVTAITSIVAVALEPVSGLLSDRFGRRPVMVIGLFATLISVLPAFWLINRYPTVLSLYCAMGFISGLFAIATPPVIISLTEGLPKRIRSGAVATIYAFAISIFGGSTGFMIAWLIRVTHNPLAPAWYWIAAMIAGLIAALLLRETAPIKVGAVPVNALPAE